ncbi:MAG: hypothetical protein CR997_00560 [Acidobacteria bacterium]|nr:MAG: hypothetical protein CR997_00560 [Acidobacteriota bacterium]
MKKKKKITFDQGPLTQSAFTELGTLISHKQPQGKSTQQAICESNPAQKTKVSLLIREEKRKGQKNVTCIYHLDEDHKNILKMIKKKLGTGGTLTKECILEIQGRKKKELESFFTKLNYRCR